MYLYFTTHHFLSSPLFFYSLPFFFTFARKLMLSFKTLKNILRKVQGVSGTLFSFFIFASKSHDFFYVFSDLFVVAESHTKGSQSSFSLTYMVHTRTVTYQWYIRRHLEIMSTRKNGGACVSVVRPFFPAYYFQPPATQTIHKGPNK